MISPPQNLGPVQYWVSISFIVLVMFMGWLLRVVRRLARKEKDIESLIKNEHVPPCPASAESLASTFNEVRELVQHNCEKNEKEHERIFGKLDELGRGLSWIMGRMGYEEKGV
jgi:hypothetical protein